MLLRLKQWTIVQENNYVCYLKIKSIVHTSIAASKSVQFTRPSLFVSEHQTKVDDNHRTVNTYYDICKILTECFGEELLKLLHLRFRNIVTRHDYSCFACLLLLTKSVNRNESNLKSIDK